LGKRIDDLNRLRECTTIYQTSLQSPVQDHPRAELYVVLALAAAYTIAPPLLHPCWI